MSASTSFVSEAELHGLVDGHIEANRRAGILRRLAASPADRVRLEAWREQSDLIRDAFAEVEREPLPVSLDLTPPPRLLCLPGREPPRLGQRPSAGARGRVAAGLATLILMGAGLGGSWILMDSAWKDQESAGPRLRGTTDETLASRAVRALDLGARETHDKGHAPALARALPTSVIPDLGSVGFSLTSAEAEAAEPASLVFRYRNAAAERLVISVARARGDLPAAPLARLGETFSWHRHDNVFAIAGTVSPERLRAIAVALQGDADDE